MERAFQALINEVNPSDRGSRWAVGAVAEWIIAAAVYKCGLLALPQGHNADESDLASVLGALREEVSIKSSFSESVSEFRLSNGMGGGGKGFSRPTIFASPKLGGLVFADPVAHTEFRKRVREKKDAVVVSIAAVRQHAQDADGCLCAVALPFNEGLGRTEPGTPFARELLEGFSVLGAVFRDVHQKNSPETTVVSQVSRLAELRDSGAIDEGQYQALLARLLEAPGATVS